MVGSIADSRKKRGRPKTGIGKAIGLRLYPDLEMALARWIKAQPAPRPSMPEAIRRLVEIGLAAAPPTKQQNLRTSAKASDMAAEQIDKLADPAMPEKERRARKRRLIKGPEEFREMRGDQSKRKG